METSEQKGTLQTSHHKRKAVAMMCDRRHKRGMIDSPHTSANLASVLQDKLRRLADERASLLAKIGDIDAKLLEIAQLMGVDVADLVRHSPLPPSRQPKADLRRAGSMIEFVIDTTRQADNGLTRGELRTILKAHPVFGPKTTRNENGFYNTVKRALSRLEIIERNGRLYGPGNAPADPALPANVTLFDRNGRDG